jgi:predicted O-linked N-acetylglucosamine transferase (SPINDLY family)
VAETIDVLVDLSGHTLGHRLPLFVFRAAPVQVSYLGYPSISGLSEMTARLVDSITDPAGEENTVSSERLVRLDGPFLCFETPTELPAPRDANGPVTFGSFNTAAKINPGVLAAWAEILRGVPESRLMLKAASFADAGVRQALTARLEALGIEGSRLTILPATKTRGEHLAAYSRVDLALDTFPYNGTTTTCEAAAMGVPTLVIRGDRHASRVGATLNTALGVPELIAENSADYVARAIKLGGDRPGLARYHASMRAKLVEGPLCDAGRLAASFTGAVRGLVDEATRAEG